MGYPSLFKPFRIKDLVIPNRITMPAMGNNLSDVDGCLTPRVLAYYLTRARGGVGMIITEAMPVNVTGRHRAKCLCLLESSQEAGLRQLTDAIHKAGSTIAIQLNHAGRLVDPKVSGGRVVCASAVPARPGATVPEAMTVDEIRETIADFARVAKKATALGFDAIEIHGAHGYLIHQFFSPRTNLRNDKFGGSLENRMRFPIEVASAVRETVGKNFPLIFRLSAKEYIEGGFEVDDALALGRRLKDAGIDILHVSAGSTESAQSSMYCIQPKAIAEGFLIDVAETFKREIDLPVIGVGRISRAETADQILRENRVDLVAMGRATLADPQWPKKAKGEIDEPIRYCIGCNRCVETIIGQQPLHCSVNPLTGNEEILPLKKPSKPKRIAVVGAGPAGLEAAVTGDMLGHKIILYEKADRIGGLLWEALAPPYKAHLNSIIDYYQARLAATGIEMHLGEAATPETLEAQAVDEVILATGSTPIQLSVPGVGLPHVALHYDVLCLCSVTGDTVLVVGGGGVGCETAEFLAEQGKNVRLIEMMDDIALDVEPRTRLLLLERLHRLSVEITTGCKLKSITPDKAVVEIDGHEDTLPAESVVLAVGVKANNELELMLQKSNLSVRTAGDCRTPGNIKTAVHQGFRAVYEALGNGA